ncbi:MAG: hypothetical protein H7061_06970 [Bdellovibrionaceae bacterium]|nr:hypothetical protein [Bdellovibrio sp.]
MKLILLATLVIISLNSFADGPQIEPGPVQPLNPMTQEVIGALLKASPDSLSAFGKAGNMLTSANVQNIRPGAARYSIANSNCPEGLNRCLGGAVISIFIDGDAIQSSIIYFPGK